MGLGLTDFFITQKSKPKVRIDQQNIKCSRLTWENRMKEIETVNLQFDYVSRNGNGPSSIFYSKKKKTKQNDVVPSSST